MSVPDEIRSMISKIKQYTEANDDLRKNAHHFCFDKRYADSDEVRFVVMGINPGEPPSDPNLRSGSVLEETSVSDFLKLGTPTAPAKRYMNRVVRMCGTDRVSQTEAFFWSSHDVNKMLSRYSGVNGSLKSHLQFCQEMNEKLIALHDPECVLFLGLTFEKRIAELYRLKSEALQDQELPFRRYSDQTGRPWLIARHPSSRITKMQLDQIKSEIAREFSNTAVKRES